MDPMSGLLMVIELDRLMEQMLGLTMGNLLWPLVVQLDQKLVMMSVLLSQIRLK